MGNLKIEFYYDGVNLNKDNYNIKVGLMQSFQIKYNTSKMCELNLNGNDFIIKLDINDYDKNLDWGSYIYPDETVKNKVIEIAYFSKKANQLIKLSHSINNIDLKKSYELENIANTAIKIINECDEYKSKYNYSFSKNEAISSLQHTINNEIKILNNLKNGYSLSKKNGYLNNAKKELANDVREIIFKLKHFNLE